MLSQGAQEEKTPSSPALRKVNSLHSDMRMTMSQTSQDNLETLKKLNAFSSPLPLMCSTEKNPRLKSANPRKSLFTLTDSKAHLISNASLPRNSQHIYKMQKGLFNSQKTLTEEVGA